MLKLTLALLLAVSLSQGAPAHVRIGSKTLTESVILGDIADALARARGLETTHRRELGGTQIVWKALLAGEIDLCPEYTGTLRRDLLGGLDLPTEESLRAHLRTLGLGMTRPLGFENTYAIGVKKEQAERLGLRRISDLQRFPKLAAGFSQEFLDRPEGWKSLKARYRLPQSDIHSVEHELGYPAIVSGSIALMDLYSTDAEIAAYGLTALEDDLHHFPSYEAVYVYRLALEKTVPGYVERLHAVSGRISAADMIGMNRRAKIDRVSEARVGADFARERFGAVAEVRGTTWVSELVARLKEHLYLVSLSLLAGLAVAIPLGVLAARWPKLGQLILSLSGIIQTIPSLALLVFMIPILGIGTKPAILALFLYSLLPIVRNTYTGLRDIGMAVHESAEALGLPSTQRLWRIELPLASRAILAGIKTSAVVNVGTATLGALVGAGGLGQPILVGIRRDDLSLILQGAIPAALLAIAVQLTFDIIEKSLVPRGLRTA